MENFIALVFVVGLVNVQGSSLFQQVLENGNGLDNKENNVREVSADIVKLTGDSSNLHNKDNRDAIRAIPFRDGLQSKDTIGSVTGHIPDNGHFRNLISIFADPLDAGILAGHGDFPDPHDAAKDLVNVFQDIRKQLQQFFDDVPDLTPSVHCQNHKCKICMAALCITMRYDPVNIGLSLITDFNGYTFLNENISTQGFRHCEPFNLPIDNPETCLTVSEVKIIDEEVCLSLGLSIFSYSHTFHHICM